MFKFLTPNGEKVKNNILNSFKTTKQLVEEIHETFYTEVDRLLAEAKISNSLETDKQYLIDKCNKLKKLGFVNTKEVIDAQNEIARLSNLEKGNKQKEHLKLAIEYFTFKYPNYKFITKRSVENICEKYGLIYGTVDKYIGTVPDKNLKHIEDFKIDDEDIIFIERYNNRHYDSITKPITYNQYLAIKDKRIIDNGYINYCIGRSLLEIVAPMKDFDMSKQEVRNFKIQDVPDPVVLCPITFEDQNHYLIVTAWGDEASDELVINNKMN